MTRQGASIAALLAVLALPGCRALNLSSLDRPAISKDPVMDETTREVVEAINANARSVQSLQAKTTIKATMKKHVAGYNAKGTLTMQRPRDFKLVLRAASAAFASEVADMGSNSDGFWFWIKSDEPAVYTCKYDAEGRLPAGIPITMQPDWIVEALGLREIPEDEAKSLKASRGVTPNTIVLKGRRPAGGGEFFPTECVVSTETKRVLSHTIYSTDRKSVLTKAELFDYRPVGPGANSETPSTVLPSRIILTWVDEGLKLDVGLNPRDVQLNASFPESLFAELEMRNAPRRDLAAMALPASNATGDGPATIRESRPMPMGRVRRLFRGPIPMNIEAEPDDSADPRPPGADLPTLPGAPTSESSTLIKPSLPQAPGDVVTREAKRPAWYGFER